MSAEQKDDVLEDFRRLAAESGVDGVPRLVALFERRKDTEGLSHGDLTALAREALATKASKQILRFPRESTSGGAVHAQHENHVWQADTASMFTFGGGNFLIAVDVFTRFVRAAPTTTPSVAESIRVLTDWKPLPEILDTDGGAEWAGARFKEFLNDVETHETKHRVKAPHDTNASAVVDRKI